MKGDEGRWRIFLFFHDCTLKYSARAPMIQYDKMLEQKKIVLQVNVECTYMYVLTHNFFNFFFIVNKKIL